MVGNYRAATQMVAPRVVLRSIELVSEFYFGGSKEMTGLQNEKIRVNSELLGKI
jgi:hypothetical protein